jgi:integration host factor subunit alpha
MGRSVLSDNMTRADIASLIQKGMGLSKSECYQLVDSIVEVVTDALDAGEMVKISGFGTFTVREKSSRIGRNPKTGQVAEISARRVLSFKASQKMRDKIAAAG